MKTSNRKYIREIIILSGGASSSEREISLLSSEMVYQVSRRIFPTTKIILTRDELPQEAIQQDVVLFPVAHGEFMEDGRLQAAMEAKDLTFIGSDSKASALCMNKFLTKQIVASEGIPVIDGVKFIPTSAPLDSSIVGELGQNLFVKPNARGSSIDTHVISSEMEWRLTVQRLNEHMEYIVERRIDGIDLTVAVLDGKALEIVEILPKHGFLDYRNKYTPGYSSKICPARIPEDTKNMVKQYCETAFKCCGCRDWARIDFLFQKSTGKVFFLEINTIPGMTQNSFYPMSADAAGIDLQSLVATLVNLAVDRKMKKINSANDWIG
ncbi:MAG: D-alanine--D-alanine ligase [Puniceicoccales bacterium]|jgi:D-alanine-D-alanine ligase|nr:D-alanine--D-alanine ligase [Puniceicoccales bacterium]